MPECTQRTCRNLKILSRATIYLHAKYFETLHSHSKPLFAFLCFPCNDTKMKTNVLGLKQSNVRITFPHCNKGRYVSSMTQTNNAHLLHFQMHFFLKNCFVGIFPFPFQSVAYLVAQFYFRFIHFTFIALLLQNGVIVCTLMVLKLVK